MRAAVCLQTGVHSGAPGGTAKEKHCPCVHSFKSQKVFASYWSRNCLWLTMLLRYWTLLTSDSWNGSWWVAIMRCYLSSCRRYAQPKGIFSFIPEVKLFINADTCAPTVPWVHKYSPPMHSYGEWTGRVPYPSYTCVCAHIYTHLCIFHWFFQALMLLVAYIYQSLVAFTAQ